MYWLWRAALGDLKTAGAERRLASTGSELLRQASWPEKALFSQLRQEGTAGWRTRQPDCPWPPACLRRWVMVTQAFSGKMILAVSCVIKPSSLSNTRCIEARNFHGHYCMPKSLWALWEGEEWMSSKPQAFTTKQNDNLHCLLTALSLQHPAGEIWHAPVRLKDFKRFYITNYY